MCGISFYCSTDKNLSGELLESLRVTSHRGPDAQGEFFKRVGKYNIGLGHNRLSIIDLSDTGKQPMMSDTGSVITYNGEVYNHEILREKLASLGYSFTGRSDTEVILKLYDEYGVKSFSMLKGMFVFTILDVEKRKLYVVRDVVGIKPVYLYEDNGAFYGCSEIKGLRKYSDVQAEVDDNDIYEFFNNGFLYEPSTGFKSIKKLLPGHYLELDLSTSAHKTESYSVVESFNEEGSLSDKIQLAIEAQQFADVPLGIFFSGGTDSSILASNYGKSELFFAKYESDPESDIDFEYSSKIADFLGKQLKVAELGSDSESVDSLLESIDFVAENSEELISDYTFWATYQLSNAARENGYKVMLSGMGGDEAFAGYPRYIVLKYHSVIKLVAPLLKTALKLGLFPRKLNKKFERLVSYAYEKNWAVAYSRMLGYFSSFELEGLFDENDVKRAVFEQRLSSMFKHYQGGQHDKVKKAQFLDSLGFLSHNLMVSDKASMLASIELRVPLLDERIVAHGFKESANKLIYKRETKSPLKAVLRSLLPSNLVERPKTGFNPPLDGIVKKIGAERFKIELSNLGSFLNIDIVEKMIDSHFKGECNNTYKLWQLLYFSRWIKHHLSYAG